MNEQQQKSWNFYRNTKTWSISEQRYSIMINGILHIPMGLSLIHIAKTHGRWHIFLFVFYALSSIARNISFMLNNHRVYLHTKTWKKLTNIFGISVSNLCIIYLMDLSKYPILQAILQYLQFGLVLILQEPKPQSYHWNWYPIICNVILFIIIHLYSIIFTQTFPRFNYKNLIISLVFFGAGYLSLSQIKAPFTYDAKQETDDYLRVYHSLCDMCIGIGFHWFWKIVPTGHPQMKKQ